MTLKTTVTGLNNFLTDIYHTDMRLSTLLARLNFTPAQIEHLRRHHTETLTRTAIDILRDYYLNRYTADPRRDWFILTRRYALDGRPADTLQTIGGHLNISRERVRQLQKRALRRYRHPACHHHLETELARTTATLLTTNN